MKCILSDYYIWLLLTNRDKSISAIGRFIGIDYIWFTLPYSKQKPSKFTVGFPRVGQSLLFIE